jgi:hypothetical protein
MKKLFILSILTVFVFASQALSLINLMDPYATEALLNRDDITYNLEFMKAADNISARDGIFLYRSHYDDQLGVTLEDIDHGNILKGLDIRIQMPLEEKVMYTVRSKAKLEGASIDDPGVDFLKSLGYDVHVVNMGVADEDDPPVDRPRPEPVLPRDEEPKPVDGIADNSAPIEIVDPVDTPVVDTGPMWTQSILLSRDEVRITILDYESEDGVAAEIILNVGNSQAIGAQVKKDISRMADFYSFAEGAIDQLEENISVMEYIHLVEPVNINAEEFDFHKAMKTELEWLRDNGVVAGLTDQDIADISAIAKAGMAGWNARIVHSDGRWFPYYETADPILIETLKEGGEPPTIDMDMPDGVAEFSTASVSPADKSITKWGKIKTGF